VSNWAKSPGVLVNYIVQTTPRLLSVTIRQNFKRAIDTQQCESAIADAWSVDPWSVFTLQPRRADPSAPTQEATPMTTISMDRTDPATWDPTLDAMVAAPRHHRLLYEDDNIRVLSVSIEPGETEPVHHHRWPSVFVVRATK